MRPPSPVDFLGVSEKFSTSLSDVYEIKGLMALSPKEIAARQRAMVRRMQVNPLEWVSTVFGDAIIKAQRSRGIEVRTKTGLTVQQEDVLRQWGDLIEAKRDRMEGKELTPKQEKLASKIGISIQSSNGNGKDFLAALVTWHWMDVFKTPRVLATANTGQQLRNVYWSEVGKLRSLAASSSDAGTHLQSSYVMQADKMYRKIPSGIPMSQRWEEGKEWFVELVTINAKATQEEQGEALAGRHNDRFLIVIDEASGIPDAVFKPLDRTMTGPINLCFMIFNPTRNTGFAIESQTKNAEQWVTVHWDALDCENISKDQIERLRKYGEDSPAYRIGVLGLPPHSDENALIPHDWILEAIDREIEPTPYDPVILAADVGGGGDRSCIGWRQGGKVYDLLTSNDRDTMKTAGWIGKKYHQVEASVAVVDANGLGAGVADRLRELEFVVHPVYGQGKSEQEQYYNVRAQMYMALREQFENKAISIPDDSELVNELGAIKMEMQSNKTKIGAKKDIRRALGFSPDKADTLAQLYAVPDVMYRRGGYHVQKLPKREYGIV